MCHNSDICVLRPIGVEGRRRESGCGRGAEPGVIEGVFPLIAPFVFQHSGQVAQSHSCRCMLHIVHCTVKIRLNY